MRVVLIVNLRRANHFGVDSVPTQKEKKKYICPIACSKYEYFIYCVLNRNTNRLNLIFCSNL